MVVYRSTEYVKAWESIPRSERFHVAIIAFASHPCRPCVDLPSSPKLFAAQVDLENWWSIARQSARMHPAGKGEREYNPVDQRSPLIVQVAVTSRFALPCMTRAELDAILENLDAWLVRRWHGQPTQCSHCDDTFINHEARRVCLSGYCQFA